MTQCSGGEYYIHNSVVEMSITYTTECSGGENYIHNTVVERSIMHTTV